MCTSLQKLVAEAIGTFALVFAGTGAVIIDSTTDGGVGHAGIGLTFGLIIMVMIYAVGHISGAHFNPAVTLGFAVGRHFPWMDLPKYWAAQLAGAVTASLLLRGLFGNVAHLGTTLPFGSAWQSLVLETVLTALLMFVITSVATDVRAVGQAAARAGNPLGRPGTPADVANAVLLVVSPLSAFISGAAIPVDGGASAGPIAVRPTTSSL